MSSRSSGSAQSKTGGASVRLINGLGIVTSLYITPLSRERRVSSITTQKGRPGRPFPARHASAAGRLLFLGAAARRMAAGAAPEPDLLGEFGALLGVFRRHHRV